jgi:transposase
LEGRQLGRPRLELDRERILADRHELGYSLKKIAKLHGISKTTVLRVLQAAEEPGPKGSGNSAPSGTENKSLTPAA